MALAQLRHERRKIEKTNRQKTCVPSYSLSMIPFEFNLEWAKLRYIFARAPSAITRSVSASTFDPASARVNP